MKSMFRLIVHANCGALLVCALMFFFWKREAGWVLFDTYWMPVWLALVLVAMLLFAIAPVGLFQRKSPEQSFERKLVLSKAALFTERLWPRLWALLGLAIVFLIVSLLGIWQELPRNVHLGLLAAFAVTGIASLVAILRVRWPSRDQALRRLELRSRVPHRPASSYEDTLTLNSEDPATKALWQAHKRRLAEQISALRVDAPEPRTDKVDPFAFRAALMLGAIVLLVVVGDGVRDRLMSAFRFGTVGLPADVRLDAWLTPPPYTGKPPVLLADGARNGINPAFADGKPVVVPANSLLIARSSGAGARQLSLEVARPDGQQEVVEGKSASSDGQVSEVRHTLKASTTVRILDGRSEVARWVFDVTPDSPPRIELLKDPEVAVRGGMKLTYKVEDDYGVASAEARFEPLPEDPGDPRTAWARSDDLKGVRPPLDRPPTFALRLPSKRGKSPEATTYNDMNSHHWGGRRVRMTLIARDHAGNEGRSRSIDMLFPERRFLNPLARSVVELRRVLATDARQSDYVRRGIDAVTHEPQGFIADTGVYLGLRSVYHRLAEVRTRSSVRSSIDHLWHIAIRLEDGRNLSDAARRLRDIQRELAKALREGASDQEIQRLMKELRQALNQYMEQLQRQAQNQPMQVPPDFTPGQSMSQRDLDRMLRDLENMARNGSREMAQQMLDQLRNLLDQLQAGRMTPGQQGQGQAGRQMMQMLDKFGNIIGQQQRLLDDTFERRRQDGQGQNQQGQDGQGQQPGQQGQQGRGMSPGELGNRQRSLRDQLDELRRGLQKFGQRAPGQLDGAGEAMENAERALRDGDLETATREQGRALEQLRQGAQQMARQMLRRAPSRFGMGPGRGADTPRDPLGRPQRSEGPDLGSSVRIPDEIDTQRAREILEELRRRAGEQNRPMLELDYIERLLERF
ncbi:MAG: hypothetical protein RLZ98_1547 [Pseudomonadota bacterium]|jgi:uncharacterized protein (TIGR02302 family)